MLYFILFGLLLSGVDRTSLKNLSLELDTVNLYVVHSSFEEKIRLFVQITFR